MHVARELLDVLERRRGQDAVAKIEDVAGAAVRAAEHSSAAAHRRSIGPSRSDGSRLPWIAASQPIASRPRRAAGASRRRSRGRRPRQGRGRIAVVPTPKWIDGTSRSASASKMRLVCGIANSR